MLRQLVKNKKAQNIAEYAITITMVIGAWVGVQTLVQRGLSGKARDAIHYMSDEMASASGNKIGKTIQYVPYYLDTNFVVNSSTNETQLLGKDMTAMDIDSTTTREEGGYQNEGYGGLSVNGIIKGL